MVNLEKIVKLLNLTNSSNDNEALSAIRMVNNILAKENKSWKDIVKVEVVPVKKKKSYRWHEAPYFFDAPFFRAMVEQREFTSLLSQEQVDAVNAMVRFFNKHKYLPEKHWAQLRDNWNKFRERNV